MRVHYIVGISIVVVCLSFCSAAYAYDTDWQTLDSDADWDTVGSGSASAASTLWSQANASGSLSGSETNSGGAATAYRNKAVYITNYDSQQDPTLTAYADGICEIEVKALYNLQNSDYQAMAGSSAYGAGSSCSASGSISDPESGEIDTDWFETEVDVSYSGATIYFGDTAWADAEAFSTSSMIIVTAYGYGSGGAQIQED